MSRISSKEGQRYNQLIDGTSIDSVDVLVEKMNSFFGDLTSSSTLITSSDIANITVTEIPDEMYVSERAAYKALTSTKIKKASGPDDLPMCCVISGEVNCISRIESLSIAVKAITFIFGKIVASMDARKLFMKNWEIQFCIVLQDIHLSHLHLSSSSEKNGNLNAFFNQYKRQFFERHSLKRPVYTLKLDQEGKIVRDKNGIPVVLHNSYVQGELKTTKQLLYREAVDGVLSSLHNIKGVLGEDTCLPGGVNALSRLFNQEYVFKGIFNLIRAFLTQCSTGTGPTPPCTPIPKKKRKVSAEPTKLPTVASVLEEIKENSEPCSTECSEQEKTGSKEALLSIELDMTSTELSKHKEMSSYYSAHYSAKNLSPEVIRMETGLPTKDVIDIVGRYVSRFKDIMTTVPSREKNKLCLPSSFAEYSSCQIVIDCTDIEIAAPKLMSQQNATCSTYRGMNSFKVITGVAPNEVITYVTDLFPGSVSVNVMVKESGFRKHLSAGDLVLTDKGFIISDVVPRGVSVNIPPFLNNGKFTESEARATKSIARCRIHVECANARLNSFRIFEVPC
ncbi:hypothetical protein AWC38_SpisGene19581 [Stylophora pistillata]|uniref:DDE Tnp4 domain-containing protein n=1 Tax=Stylophora pistillata TaxID=50429 RepID=A0A2B4RH50_STYPI|nr:hypothetical protein AWC38_SpisGene19581 [Stylophora pistillata]